MNSGSVGVPGDDDPKASDATLDTRAKHATLGRVKYDPDGVVSKLKDLVGEDQEVFELLGGWLRTAEQWEKRSCLLRFVEHVHLSSGIPIIESAVLRPLPFHLSPCRTKALRPA